MKPLVIYHANCTDGFGAAFAAWLKLGDEAEYRPMNYTNDRALLEDVVASATNRETYILDFSFPRDVMDAIFENAKRVVWLDHHASVFKDWGVPLDDVADELTLGLVQPNDHTVVLNNNGSGAMLAWHNFHPGTEVPMLIQHIDDRDRWVFALPGSKEIHAALASYKPWSFEQWEDRFLVGRIRFGELKDEGAAILRAHNQNVQSALKQARECEIVLQRVGYHEGFSGLAGNAPAFLASDLGCELANKSGTFGLVWSMAGDGQIHCSLRSNGDYDVSAIAKAFGGGGHRNAAGFSTDIDTLMSWLK